MTRSRHPRLAPWVTLAIGLLGGTGTAAALPGRYVSAAGEAPSSDAATAVIALDGDRTVLTLQQPYVGPGGDVALVVPVPASVRPEDVRTLRTDALARVERLAAPRLVELWERDPCPRTSPSQPFDGPRRIEAPPETPPSRAARDGYAVTLVDPSAPGGLEAALRGAGLAAPAGLAVAARPYAARGMRILVARLRRTARGDAAAPPPLQIRMRGAALALPLGLGTVGAQAPQELVVHVLARTRVEAGGRENVLAPTNLVMLPPARERFDAVYATILERVYSRHPAAVVTEYAWPADGCAPCAAPPLDDDDLEALGGGGIDGAPRDFVLSRLHLWVRDGDPDLTLREGPPVSGGRGVPGAAADFDRRLMRGAEANAFQTRYAILHRRPGAPRCAAPRRDVRWGAPPGRRRPAPQPAHLTRETIPTGRLRRYLHTWTPVLRIPVRGPATSTAPPPTRRRRGARR